jgi:hypothetical protein
MLTERRIDDDRRDIFIGHSPRKLQHGAGVEKEPPPPIHYAARMRTRGREGSADGGRRQVRFQV